MPRLIASRIAIFLLWTGLLAPALAAEEVRVGIYQNEPKLFIDDAGRPAGFFVDIINAIAAQEGWRLRYVACVWRACLDQLERGDIDIMLDVAHIPERDDRFDFGNEVVLSSWSVLYKRAGGEIDSILDLEGRKVAVLANSVQYHAIRERAAQFDVHPRFVAVDSFDDAFARLQRGTVDYVLANRFYGAQHMARYDAAETNILIKPSLLKLAFPKQADGRLRDISDRQLRRLKHDKSSVYYQSLERWLKPLDKSRLPGWAKWAVLAAGIMLVALVGLVALLRHMVNLRTAQVSRQQHDYQHLSRHDPLTELPNRQSFVDRVERAMRDADRRHTGLHLFFMDLDQFKHINDSRGHAVGDDILRSVSVRLREAAGDDGLIARLGGDEFALLSDSCRDQNAAHALARRLMSALDAPLVAGDRSYHLSMTVGISRYPQDGNNVQDLMKHADTALFHAKDRGRRTFAFYSPDMSDHAMRRVTLEAELKKALAMQQLVLHYQPQFELASGQVVGTEALVRWRHPDMGLIPPDHFIPVAEETGMINELGEQVMRTACAQMVDWQEAGIGLRRVAVNVSPRQFHDEGFFDRVIRVIGDTGCRPEWVAIEITESAILDDRPENLAMLERLRSLGFAVAIDDFGMGYSSLSRLKELPVTKLKIDLSFVQCLPDDPGGRAIVRAIIALGDGLGLSVLAEGIETEAQRDFLHQAGCAQGQGYLYSPPLAAAEITAMLKRRAGASAGDPS